MWKVLLSKTTRQNSYVPKTSWPCCERYWTYQEGFRTWRARLLMKLDALWRIKQTWIKNEVIKEMEGEVKQVHGTLFTVNRTRQRIERNDNAKIQLLCLPSKQTKKMVSQSRKLSGGKKSATLFRCRRFELQVQNLSFVWDVFRMLNSYTNRALER